MQGRGGTSKAIAASKRQRQKYGQHFGRSITGQRSPQEYSASVVWTSVINVNGQRVRFTKLQPFVPKEESL